MSTWQLQDAKARLSELVKRAKSDGPQEIRVHGEPAVVVVAHQEYLRLTQPPTRFVDFIRHSPLKGAKLDLKRDRSPARDVDL
jgi:prevent-host-death family protein